MKTSVYIAVSLDGFIAGPGGSLDWLKPFTQEDEDYGYAEFIKSVDVIVMGRKTFETVAGFLDWPYTVPVYVISRSLTVIAGPLSKSAIPINLEPQAVLDYLSGLGFQHAYIDGGQTISSFLQAGLIDQIRIFRMPVILGQGTPLFSDFTIPVNLKLVRTKAYQNGVTESLYTV